jgi:hypothetical protein
VERAWPFEQHSDPVREPRSPKEFVARESEEVEAVVSRTGLSGAQAVLVTQSGIWRRWVYPTMDEALGAAREAGCRVHEQEFPEALRVRINSYRRPAEDFRRAPYPEQGWVGPVRFYPENRPRPGRMRDRGRRRDKEEGEEGSP